MSPIEFEGQTRLLNPPIGTPKGDCGALPVYFKDGIYYSIWKLDKDDLRRLNEGGYIRLTVHSIHPPVWIDTLSKGQITEAP